MKEFFSSVVGVILIIALFVGMVFGSVFMLRPYLDLRRQAIQSSQQYTETKQRMLMQWVQEYHETDSESVKNALRERMRLEVENVPVDQVPSSVREIIGRY